MRYSELWQDISETRIDELFNTTVDYLVTSNSKTKFSAEREINGRLIKFTAESMNDDSGMNTWEVLFSQHSLESKGGRGTFGITGSGGELTVLAMMIAAMGEFISHQHPDVILFSAGRDSELDSRAKVYDRMLRKYLPTDYKVTQVKQNHNTDFRIEKIY